MYAWLNGTLLGYSQDSRLPAEFEVTGLIKEGKNVLVLQVRREALLKGIAGSISARIEACRVAAVEERPGDLCGHKEPFLRLARSSSGATGLTWKIRTCGGCRESTGTWVFEKSGPRQHLKALCH